MIYKEFITLYRIKQFIRVMGKYTRVHFIVESKQIANNFMKGFNIISYKDHVN